MMYFMSIHPNGTQIAFVDEPFHNYLWSLTNLFGQPSAANQ